MDTSPNIEADVSKLNEKFAEYFPGGEFNATRNTIVPCCSFQLDNELKMEKDKRDFCKPHPRRPCHGPSWNHDAQRPS